MAKAKIKLDSKALQAWFGQHAEKIGMAVAAGVLVWMAYSSITLGGYKKKPADLANSITSAKDRIDKAHLGWDIKEDGINLPNPPYADQVASALKELDPKPFEWVTAFNRPLFENRKRRGEPIYLPPIELHAQFVQGAIAMQGDNAVAGHHWIVLTAAIPYRDQQGEYDKQFKNAVIPFDPQRDKPKYVDFAIERAEFAGSAAGEPKWQAIDLDAAYAQVEKFAAQRTELADPGALESFMPVQDTNTAATPPYLNLIPSVIEPAPGKEYVHEPQIPISDKGARVEKTATPAPGGRRRPGTTAPPTTTTEAKPADVVKVFDFRLFRFCDFSTRRGMQYRYRVKLILENPNKTMKEFELQDKNLVQGETRESVWSQPSNSVEVPGDYQLAAIDVRPAVSTSEAVAKFMLIRFAERFGVIAGHAVGAIEPTANPKTYERGTRVHFMAQQAKVRTAGSIALVDGQVDFPFDGLLAGISGGEAGKSRQKAPAELIFLWPDGRLDLHTHIGDSVLIDSIEHPQPPAAVAAAPSAPAATSSTPPTTTTTTKEAGKEAPKQFGDFFKTKTPEKK